MMTPGSLDEILADDVVFYSPVVFASQRDLTRMYRPQSLALFGRQPTRFGARRVSFRGKRNRSRL